MIKARTVRHFGARFRAASLARHIRYLQREGVTRDGSPGSMFDARGEQADVEGFATRCQDDRHHFRFIVSPEDAAELTDLRAFTRELMDQAERDLGTRLDWVAIDHWNTDNPHLHLLVRGRADDGSDLVISRDYIGRGLRARAQAQVSLELGPRSDREIEAALWRDAAAERWTRLDRALRDRADDAAGLIDLRPIEVVRGATGLVTGAGDPSATINMVRKRPTEDFRASTSLSAGSWNYRRGEIDVSGPLAFDGKIRGRLVGAYTDRESYVRFQHDKSPSLYGVIEADLTDKTRLRVGADYLRTDSQGGAWSAAPLFFRDGTPATLPRSYSAGAKWNRWQRESVNLFGVLEHEFGGGWVGRLAYNNRSTDTDSLLLAGSNSGGFADKITGLGLPISDTYTVTETREQSLDAYASGPFEAFGRTHELVVGGNFFNRDLRTINAAITSRPYSLTAFPSIFTWTGDIGLPGVSNTGKPRAIANTTEAGLYAAVRLNPTDRLKVIGGARFTDWDTHTDNFSAASGAFTSTTGRYGENRVSPYLGVLYDLTGALTAFVSYADVFQPQNLKTKDFEQIAPKIGGNYEAGLKAEFFDKRLYASLNGFYMQQDNVATLDPSVLPNSLPDGSSAYIATSGVKTKGGELEVSGSITPAWSITGGYTYTHNENAAGQRVFTVNPLHMVKLYSTYKLGAWTLGGGLTWQTEVYQNQAIPTGRFTTAGAPITAQGRVTQGGYALADALVRYAFSNKVSVGVNVTNLFDEHYYRNVGYFNGGYWGEPRRVLFNLRARY